MVRREVISPFATRHIGCDVPRSAVHVGHFVFSSPAHICRLGHPLLHMGLGPYATASLARIWKLPGHAMRARGVCFPCAYLPVERTC